MGLKLTQIPLGRGFGLTQIPLSLILLLMMINLTEALRSLAPKAHTDSTRFNKNNLC